MTGQWNPAFAVAVFFELLWLDLIAVGTVIPPHSPAAFILAITTATFFGFSSAGDMLFPLLLVLPLAKAGTYLEVTLRRRWNRGYNSLIRSTAPGKHDRYLPGTFIARAVFETILTHFFFFMISCTAVIALTGILRGHFQALVPDFLDWKLLWLVAAIGGLLSLRTPRAYGAMAFGIGAVTVFAFFGMIEF
jgi:PTS system mannose-specific IIC component